MSAVIRSGGAPRLVKGLTAAALTLGILGGTTAAAVPQAWAGDTPVKVIESEFFIALSKKNFHPGTHTFRIRNVGFAPHALSIKGPGVSTTSKVIPGGGRAKLTVSLKKGTYRVWCPVDRHLQKGMATTIRVR
ncbi:hypothetical protein GCM10010517_21110 [Streptosporangium fragile]|uniref:EfeO-type cupredoxin-like domain-containing protein n=1 Tax=Streptosporangium fragile TaxID=46186 RepID=A0ABN3VUQ5_9ACTN